jgi:hypothetical protein
MKKFKEFLENYDFYIDKPYGWKSVNKKTKKKKNVKPSSLEITTADDRAQEEMANEVGGM